MSKSSSPATETQPLKVTAPREARELALHEPRVPLIAVDVVPLRETEPTVARLRVSGE